MGRVINLAAFVALAMTPVSCAGVAYRYFGLEAQSYDGTLLGPKPKDDLPFEYCKPTAQVKSPCVVMFQDEFFRLKQELLQLRADLRACQGGR